jgi:hypothetical protein
VLLVEESTNRATPEQIREHFMETQGAWGEAASQARLATDYRAAGYALPDLSRIFLREPLIHLAGAQDL